MKRFIILLYFGLVNRIKKMASGFFALFDDIAALMDDVAATSKIATQKTAGLLADDLAVNAEKASGFISTRELPVLWKISKGSFLNKLIILPAAFLLSAFLPQAIVPILILGGLYLSYEGAEKVFEFFFHRKSKEEKNKIVTLSDKELTEHETKKVKSAIFVDFILSIEIVIIALGTVLDKPLKIQIPVVSIIAIIATIGVYGVVTFLVRLDDMGYKLIANSEGKGFSKSFGIFLVKSLPYIIRSLAIIGTLAMILVAGGIFVHNLHFIHDLVHFMPAILGEFIVGLIVGIIVLMVVKLFLKLKGK